MLEKVVIIGISLAIFLFLIDVYLNSRRITRHGQPLRKPPNTLPLVGNGLVFLRDRNRLFEWFVRCERAHGLETLALSVPTLPPGVLINDPRNLEFVFKHEGVFTKGDFVKRRSWDLFGNGIINADGEFWKVQRKAGLHFLSAANLKVLTDIALPRDLAVVAHQVADKAGGVVDLQHVFHEITTRLMGKVAYNFEGMHADDDFSRAFDYASGKTAERFQNPLWLATDVVLGSRFRKAVAMVKDFGARIVSNAVHERARTATEKRRAASPGEDNSQLDEVSGSLINSLLDAIGDEEIVADAALTYLTAGRDTTGQALTWCFYLMMRHPSVLANVRAEVSHLLANTHIPPSAPFSDMETALFTPLALPYTTAVFYETLRLFPPIPFEIRQTTCPTTLPDGTILPRAAVVVWCVWAMGRARHTWGANADDFIPERWLDRGRFVGRSAAEFPVFNGGPRTCLGKKMAEAIAVQSIAAMSWRFDFEEVEKGSGVRRSKSSMTLPMEGGLPVRVRIREGE